MLLDGEGWAVDPKVTKQPYYNLRKGEMTAINGIVVHQTASPTLQATLNSYQSANPNGAHFLIDKDGTLYQTASIHWLLWHVGMWACGHVAIPLSGTQCLHAGGTESIETRHMEPAWCP